MTRSDSSGASGCAIGVDVGGTKIAAGLVVFPEGHVVARRRLPTYPERGGAAVLGDVTDVVRELQQEAAGSGVQATRVGICVAELIDTDGSVLSDATIKWKGRPVGELLRAETGLPVSVDADVRAAARGEAHFGAGRGLKSFLYVTIGTGISASLVIEGAPYGGARGLTGTFASARTLIADDDGQLVAGMPLEQFAAGPALASRLAALRNGFTGDAAAVLSLAEAGDDLSLLLVTSGAQAVGASIANLVNMLDPAAVVMGGGLGVTEGIYRRFVDRGLRAHIWSDMHRDAPLLSAKLRDDAGVIGAAIAAIAR